MDQLSQAEMVYHVYGALRNFLFLATLVKRGNRSRNWHSAPGSRNAVPLPVWLQVPSASELTLDINPGPDRWMEQKEDRKSKGNQTYFCYPYFAVRFPSLIWSIVCSVR